MKSPGSGGVGQVQIDETFYVQIYHRLVRIMIALALAGSVAVWLRYGGKNALVFFAGSLIALLNFHWLKRTLDAIGERLEATGRTPSSWGVVIRFLLRYVLIAATAYVILKSTTNSLYGFFGGLFLPVGAILIEAVYETYKALRTGL